MNYSGKGRYFFYAYFRTGFRSDKFLNKVFSFLIHSMNYIFPVRWLPFFGRWLAFFRPMTCIFSRHQDWDKESGLSNSKPTHNLLNNGNLNWFTTPINSLNSHCKLNNCKLSFGLPRIHNIQISIDIVNFNTRDFTMQCI